MRTSKSNKRMAVFSRRTFVILTVLVVIALGLTLGLVFGLRSRNNFGGSPLEFSESWNNPSEFVLSKNFTITNTTTTRYYEWTVSQNTIAPDGLERPMLLVN
ncbi:hypothetical protein BGZ80_011067, partial [Entomortierella chlamydospora]